MRMSSGEAIPHASNRMCGHHCRKCSARLSPPLALNVRRCVYIGVGGKRPRQTEEKETEMTTQTADIMDLLGDAAQDFAEEQISAIAAAVSEIKDRLTAKYGEMSDTDMVYMILTLMSAIIAVSADEAELTDYVSAEDAFEALLNAAAYM